MRHDQIPCHDEDFSGYCSGCSYVGEDHGRDDIVAQHRRALRSKRLESAYSMLGCAAMVLWPIVAFVVLAYALGRLG
jgi:hypothetical protein